MCAIPINEVPALSISGDVMASTEHGSQHGVFVAPQRGQSCGEVSPSNVKGDNLRKLERNSCMFSQGRGMRARRLRLQSPWVWLMPHHSLSHPKPKPRSLSEHSFLSSLSPHSLVAKTYPFPLSQSSEIRSLHPNPIISALEFKAFTVPLLLPEFTTFVPLLMLSSI